MKRHPLDPVSLVFGLVFVGLGTLHLTGNDVGGLVAQFWPVALVALGLAILLTAHRNGDATAGSTPVSPAARGLDSGPPVTPPPAGGPPPERTDPLPPPNRPQ